MASHSGLDGARRKGVARVALIVLLLATSVPALGFEKSKSQAAAQGQGPANSMMQSMPAPGPAMMLLHRTQLGIDDAQARRLETLAAEQQQNMQRLMPQAMRAMADLMEAASGNINVDAARKAHELMARAHTEMLVTNLQAMKNAQQILTPEQRTRWDAITAQMGGMMSMMGPMMMGPMMMGPMKMGSM